MSYINPHSGKLLKTKTWKPFVSLSLDKSDRFKGVPMIKKLNLQLKLVPYFKISMNYY